MYNCIYDCRYCFLQGMYNSANFVVFGFISTTNLLGLGITFFAMSVDDTANVNSLLHLNSTGDYMYTNFISVINIGSGFTGGANVGQYTSWGGSTKKLSVKVRDYSNSYDATLFDFPNLPHADWYTSGFASGTAGSGTNGKQRPYVGITAIGSLP